MHQVDVVETVTNHVPLLPVVVSVSQVKLVEVVGSVDYRVSGITARIIFLLYRMKVVVSAMMAILSISASKVAVGTSDVVQRTVVRPKANLRCSLI